MTEITPPWPRWEEKCWGKVLHAFHSPDVALSYLEVEAGWQCSTHKHADRINAFVVLSGEIKIDWWGRHEPKGNPSSVIILPSNAMGNYCIVPAGVWHRFRVIRSGKVVEIYWPRISGARVRLDDIVRLDIGGRIDA